MKLYYKFFSAIKIVVLITLSLFIFFSCATEVGNPPVSKIEILGLVSKGPIQNSLVELYSLNEDGSRGKKLSTVKTDENARFSIELEDDITDPLILIASGGEFSDEATAKNIVLSENDSLTLFLDSISAKNIVSLTALTEIASRKILKSIEKGISTKQELKELIQQTNKDLAEKFGLSSIKINPENPTSTDQNANSEKTKYTLIQAAISQYAYSQGELDVMQMLNAMAKDYSDGIFNGKENTEDIELDNGLKLESTAMQEGLKNAFENFIASDKNETGIPASQTQEIISSIPLFQ